MIELRSVWKTVGRGTSRATLFRRVNATLTTGSNYLVIGERRSGKTTLLGLMSGLSRPSLGRIRRKGTVSFPPGQGHLVAGLDTVPEFIKVMSVTYGVAYRPLLDFVLEFSEIGDLADTPIVELPSEIRMQLMSSISYGISADYYCIDNHVGFGGKSFVQRCETMYQQRMSQACIIRSIGSLDNKAEWAGFRTIVIANKSVQIYDTYQEGLEALNQEVEHHYFGRIEYADILLKKGFHDQAIAYMHAFIEQYPNDESASLYLIKIATPHVDLDILERIARAHLDRFGPSKAISFSLATLYEKSRRFNEAMYWVDFHLNLNPSNYDALRLKARCLGELGEHSSSAAIFSSLTIYNEAAMARLAIRAYIKAENWSALVGLIDRIGPTDNADGFLEQKGRALVHLRQVAELETLLDTLRIYDERAMLRLISRALTVVDVGDASRLSRFLIGMVLLDTEAEKIIENVKLVVSRRYAFSFKNGDRDTAAKWLLIRDNIKLNAVILR